MKPHKLYFWVVNNYKTKTAKCKSFSYIYYFGSENLLFYFNSSLSDWLICGEEENFEKYFVPQKLVTFILFDY